MDFSQDGDIKMTFECELRRAGDDGRPSMGQLTNHNRDGGLPVADIPALGLNIALCWALRLISAAKISIFNSLLFPAN